MIRDTGKRKDKLEDDLTMLQQIRDENPAAGSQFLEYLVLQKRSLVSVIALYFSIRLITVGTESRSAYANGGDMC